VLHDDATDLTSAGPVCVNSLVAGSAVNPSLGAVRLSLRVYFANTLDKIVIRGLGLLLQRTGL
jgi:hypothetical protein